MLEFNTIEDVADKIKTNFDAKTNNPKITSLYAFNSTGKTRLSNLFNKEDENNVLCYNAFIEDLFKWDNQNYILTIDPSSWVVQLINEQGIEKEIIDNFSNFINSKLEPYFDLSKGEISFNIPSGDDDAKNNIKISKGEESIFIWSIFHTILETAIGALNIKEDDRTTSYFDDLEYIIVDDPFSSIDDNLIVQMSINLISVISNSKNDKLKFLITTHHALFYNILFNSLRNNDSRILSKNGTILKLEKQRDDSPFGYHLVVKDTIQKAINSNAIEKYHFNLFRSLLEKTANFLGYKYWKGCLLNDDKELAYKLLNLESHAKLSDLESKELSDNDKRLFKDTFEDFIENFKWKKD